MKIIYKKITFKIYNLVTKIFKINSIKIGNTIKILIAKNTFQMINVLILQINKLTRIQILQILLSKIKYQILLQKLRKQINIKQFFVSIFKKVVVRITINVRMLMVVKNCEVLGDLFKNKIWMGCKISWF